MLKGRAHGGPRDGVKLIADLRWDGRVLMPSKGNGKPQQPFPGWYQWDWDFGAWIWHKDRANAGTP